MQVNKFKDLMAILANQATKHMSLAQIATLLDEQKDEVVAYLMSLKHPVIAELVTYRFTPLLKAAGYSPGFNNQHFSYWLLPRQKEQFAGECTITEHNQEVKTELLAQSVPALDNSSSYPHPIPRLATPNMPPRASRSDLRRTINAEMALDSGQQKYETTPRTCREIIPLRAHEMALDLWTFDYNQREKEWIIAGLYQTGLLLRLESQQFAKRYQPDGTTPFFIQGESVISVVYDSIMRDNLKAYIDADPNLVTVENLSATYEIRVELFNRQQHLTINPKGLEKLKTHARPILRDTATTCFIPFRSGIVQITAQTITVLPYKILDDKCIWQSQILNRDFDQKSNGDDCHFARFIRNVTNGEPDRTRAFRSAIGYLLHHHGNPSEGQAVICYDEEITDARKPEGGTGKGLFANALRQIRPVAVIDGKKFDQNDRFCLQQVNQDTAITWIDDPVVNHPKAERRFTLERFFSTLTEGWEIEKKHNHSFRIPAKEGPKLLISSNVMLPNEGSSNIRRQFILEFSNHYKKQILNGHEKPIQTEHGCLFFSEDWNEQEWHQFDRFMISCIQEYLRDGLQPYRLRSADQNRLRQTAGEDFYEWATGYNGGGLLVDQEYNRDELFRDYKVYAGLSDTQTPTRGFTNNITQYAKSKGWKYDRGADRRVNTFTLRSC